jgi:hypothetical protein
MAAASSAEIAATIILSRQVICYDCIRAPHRHGSEPAAQPCPCFSRRFLPWRCHRLRGATVLDEAGSVNALCGRAIDLSPAVGRALNMDGLASVSLIVGDADASPADERATEPVSP